MVHSDIKIRAFTGSSFKEFIPCIARLRLEIFREYPDLYESSLEEEKRHLREYAEHPESIAVLVFDGTTVVGASTGIPLICERKELHKVFQERNIDLASYFYFDTSLLLKQYRGRGIGHHFFDLRESHAGSFRKYKHACFFATNRPETHPKRPTEYLSLHNFWRKRGYVHHPDMLYHVWWQDVGEEDVTEKPLSCWMKELGD